ncbi:hypothetical protein [Hymenobacter properus]|uniref:Uncharacterized protein n=1 Tax=Hymenobacter properus TaxID=2791026 RepID=A0A931BG22_9BACT|nr:hypothetical protein [Hymenobacter properus]MBF9143255.1 hypothetical protein [Hymenobacter properus]MBR7722065.1 hypothetical protein [Microvirga sp. SRT04]
MAFQQPRESRRLISRSSLTLNLLYCIAGVLFGLVGVACLLFTWYWPGLLCLFAVGYLARMAWLHEVRADATHFYLRHAFKRPVWLARNELLAIEGKGSLFGALRLRFPTATYAFSPLLEASWPVDFGATDRFIQMWSTPKG